MNLQPDEYYYSTNNGISIDGYLNSMNVDTQEYLDSPCLESSKHVLDTTLLLGLDNTALLQESESAYFVQDYGTKVANLYEENSGASTTVPVELASLPATPYLVDPVTPLDQSQIGALESSFIHAYNKPMTPPDYKDMGFGDNSELADQFMHDQPLMHMESTLTVEGHPLRINTSQYADRYLPQCLDPSSTIVSSLSPYLADVARVQIAYAAYASRIDQEAAASSAYGSIGYGPPFPRRTRARSLRPQIPQIVFKVEPPNRQNKEKNQESKSASANPLPPSPESALLKCHTTKFDESHPGALPVASESRSPKIPTDDVEEQGSPIEWEANISESSAKVSGETEVRPIVAPIFTSELENPIEDLMCTQQLTRRATEYLKRKQGYSTKNSFGKIKKNNKFRTQLERHPNRCSFDNCVLSYVGTKSGSVLDLHITASHLEMQSLRCRKCGKDFSRTDALRRHTRLVHKDITIRRKDRDDEEQDEDSTALSWERVHDFLAKDSSYATEVEV